MSNRVRDILAIQGAPNIGWLLIILVLTAGSAWSDDPIPGSTEKIASPQKQASNTKQPTAEDYRGTEKQPLFVKVVDSPQTETNATKNENKSSDKPAFVWGMAAEEATAIFTGLLVVVGALTAAVLIGQSYFLRRSVNLARDEFISTHRPKIRIRHVWIRGRIGPSKRITIDVVVVNSGISPAFLREFNAKVLIQPSDRILPQEPYFMDNTKATMSDYSLLSGIPYVFKDRPGEHLTTDDANGVLQQTHVMYCYGYVEYADAAHNIRKTAFFRRLKVVEIPDGKIVVRFEKEDDPDYEYED